MNKLDIVIKILKGFELSNEDKIDLSKILINKVAIDVDSLQLQGSASVLGIHYNAAVYRIATQGKDLSRVLNYNSKID